MKTVLAFGDSNTWGLIPGTNRRYSFSERWTGLVQQKGKNLRIIEEGLCGRTTVFEDRRRKNRKGIDLLPTLIEAQSPLDGAIIMLGTNDCKAYFEPTPEKIGEGISRCLDELQKFLPPKKILLVSPISLGEDVWLPEKDPEFDKNSVEVSRKLKEVYSNIARKRGIEFLAASDYALPSEIDCEHLSPDSHKALSEVILKKLKSMGLTA